MKSIRKHQSKKQISTATIDRNFVQQCLLYFSLQGSDEAVRKFVCFFMLNNNKSNTEEDYRNKLINFILFANDKERIKLKAAFNFMEIIIQTFSYFDVKDDRQKIVNIVFSKIIEDFIANYEIYVWKDDFIYRYRINDYSFKDLAEGIQPIIKHKVERNGNNFIKIEGFNLEIPINNFVQAPVRVTKGDYARYLSFYSQVKNALKTHMYCSICNPYGIPEINQKTGEPKQMQYCSHCKNLLNLIKIFFKDEKAKNRVRDTLLNSEIKKINDKKIDYSGRKKAFRKAFEREWERAYNTEILRNVNSSELEKISKKRDEILKMAETIFSNRKTF